MAVSKNQISGNTSMLLLKLLSEKDMYGYEMINTLSVRSENVFELKVGTLYPLLHSLVQSGYLNSYDREVNGKIRKYYQITPSGRKYLDKMIKEWTVYANAVALMIGS
ncbi:MAG: PadR family transcriptional regulator [Dorea sp.]|jgi:PadR family transcriptional regulator PadR|nr:PadR family transcriptional regulator [Dorea sp.]